MTNENKILAIDVGGTNIKCAIVSETFSITDRESMLTPGKNIDEALKICLEKLLARNTQSPLNAIGIGLPEYVQHGVIKSSMVIDWASDTSKTVGSLVNEIYGLTPKIKFESDVRCAALAEFHLGKHQNSGSLLYISWGTGISSTLVMPNGESWVGSRGEAISFGEWLIELPGEVTTLEKLASGHGLENRYFELTEQRLSTIEINDLARKGDVVAQDFLGLASEKVGQSLANYVHVIDPSLVILGGGIGSSANLLSENAMLQFQNLDNGRGWPGIACAALGADSGLLGAAFVAKWSR